MKKFIVILMFATMFVVSMNAQVAPAKFLDNISVGVKGGVNTTLNDLYKGVSGQAGLQVEKGITPWLGVAVEGETFFAQPYGSLNPHTSLDGVNVNALAKLNVLNLFSKYPGYRRNFEMDVFTGIGWGHRTCSESFDRNFMTYKAGADFTVNLGKQKAWGIVLSPAVTWGHAVKLDKNNGMLEVNAGVVYHFKNHDGNRYFSKVRLYDARQINYLRGRLNELVEEVINLREQNALLNDSLSKVPATVTETITVTETFLPAIQFTFDSYDISNTSIVSIYEIAEIIKKNPDKTYNVVGYASNEGSEEYNMTLSKNRAEAVAYTLVHFGVNPNQLIVVGGGINTTYPEPALNRVVITSQNL